MSEGQGIPVEDADRGVLVRDVDVEETSLAHAGDLSEGDVLPVDNRLRDIGLLKLLLGV